MSDLTPGQQELIDILNIGGQPDDPDSDIYMFDKLIPWIASVSNARNYKDSLVSIRAACEVLLDPTMCDS